MATVYLIHFDRPIGSDEHSAQHYLGFAKNLKARLRHHQTGNGAAIMAAVSALGIGWKVVKTWETTTDKEAYLLEVKLKSRHNHKALCPVCNPKLI